MAFTVEQSDLQALDLEFPGLNFSRARNCIWGTLSFACSCDRKDQKIIYSNCGESYIEDSYEIKIDFSNRDTFGFPVVYEESERIATSLKAGEIDDSKRHIDTSDGSCCLGIFPEYQWNGVTNFLYEKVIPFFYWYSFLQHHGEPPWHGFAHGHPGLIQAMSMVPSKVLKGRYSNKLCPCDSGKKYKVCCKSRDLALLRKIPLKLRIP
ncbi:SEC-C domain-containing protein [Persicirhabdus sediminis]|uniref:SEC-C domain-containing protein n=1 Tax=Persicirhabdus sediminis TaxID=454144 RepID=A0A8J7SJV4_9BACT|nr:SEC-C domain-containing protein [Persicirhabdus sediminis]MBK1791351.1 SEC-C domain-containing protein [Persicirhabdus sediminis]